MAKVAANVEAIKRVLRENVDGDKQLEYRVEGVPGLVLIAQKSGAGTWSVEYRNKYGKRRKYRLGEFGAIGLAEARQRTGEIRAAAVRGEDPAGDRLANREAMTVRELCERFLVEADLSVKTRGVYRACLEKDVFDRIGDMPADDVTEDDVMSVCQAILRRGARVQADRTKTTIGGAYRWAKKMRLVSRNPARDIGRLSEKVARNRTPSADELKVLWEGLDDTTHGMSKATRAIIKLCVLTGQRRDEVCGARVSELVDLDGDEPLWVIPGDSKVRGKVVPGRTKNGREQIVPLPPSAAALFRGALVGSQGGYVFPADTSTLKIGQKPRSNHIHGESVTMAMRRLRARIGVEDLTVHDMRRAVANWMIDNDVSKEVVDRVLNHVDQSVTGAHYANSARMTRQVRAALSAWADHVMRVVEGKDEGAGESVNVVKLRA